MTVRDGHELNERSDVRLIPIPKIQLGWMGRRSEHVPKQFKVELPEYARIFPSIPPKVGDLGQFAY